MENGPRGRVYSYECTKPAQRLIIVDGATYTSPVLIYSDIQLDYHLGCATITRLKYFPQTFGLISIEAPQKAKTACHIQAGQSDLVRVLIKATQLLRLFPPGAERNNFSLRYTPALSAAFNVKMPSGSAKTATSGKKKKQKGKTFSSSGDVQKRKPTGDKKSD